MATQEPINTQDCMASFKGFMDKAVAQASDEEPVFLRSLHAHFGKEPKDLPTVKSEPYEIYTGLAVEFEDPFGNRLGITGYSKQANRVSETAAPHRPKVDRQGQYRSNKKTRVHSIWHTEVEMLE